MNEDSTRRGALLAAAGLFTLGSCGWEPLPQKKAPVATYAFGIRIAAETTQIAEPLLPNGTPDYAAAINASTGMGVNLENNAVHELAPLLGMNLSQKIRERLNVGPEPAPEERIVGAEEHFRASATMAPAEALDSALEAFRAEAEVLEGGYCSTAACPKIAEWLSANDLALAAIAAALGKPRFWVPLEDGENLYRSPTFALDGFRETCRALGARASLRLGDENWIAASSDILTAERIGGLLGQSTLALAQSTAAECIAEGNDALVRAASDPTLDVAAARELLGGLEELSQIGNFELVLQHERFEALAGVFLLREIAGERGASAWKDVLAADGRPEGLYRLEVSSIDWVEALSVVNRSWDLARELVWSTTGDATSDAGKRFSDELQFTRETRANLSDPLLSKLMAEVDRDPEARRKLTRAFVDAAGFLPVGVPLLVRSVQEALAKRELGLVALAIAAHRKEAGKLPDSLDLLSPRYLERIPPATQFGHVLRMNRGDSGELALTLVPVRVNVTGSRSYCIDSEGRTAVLTDGREPKVVDGRCTDAVP